MLSASYYLRKGDYVEADHLYELLRKEFPKSRHLENAYVLGAHCKLMCYQGPEYGGTELDEAKKLMQPTIHLYPHRPDRARMEDDLQKIELAKAAQLWANVKFWKVKDKPKAVAICCKEVIQKYPELRLRPHGPRRTGQDQARGQDRSSASQVRRQKRPASTVASRTPSTSRDRGPSTCRQVRRRAGPNAECRRSEKVASGPWRVARKDDARFACVLALATLLFVAAILATSGCGYTIGNQFQHNVQTVYVPIATSEDFRRGTEFQLTEAVQKQIQERTPFRLAKDEAADTKLTMKIKSIRKIVLGTTAQNDARELQVAVRRRSRLGRSAHGPHPGPEQGLDRARSHAALRLGRIRPRTGPIAGDRHARGHQKMARQIVD